MTVLENNYLIAWMEEDVFVTEYKKNAFIDLPEAMDLIRQRNDCCDGKRIKILVIHCSSVTITSKAKEYFVKEGSKNVEKFALVSQSYFSSLIGNAFLKIMTPEIPTKIFINKEDAFRWLSI